MKRVKFYSVNDLMYGYNLKNVESIINGFKISKSDYSINDIIEFYNIQRYIDEGIFLKEWSNEYINEFKELSVNFKSIVGRFFATISDDSIIPKYLEVEIKYREDFWSLYEKNNLFKKISDMIFEKLIWLDEVQLYHVLHHKKIVRKYGEIIQRRLLEDDSAARILLDKYEMKINIENKEIYLPSELTKEDKEKIILNYINSPIAHLNVLEVIQNIKSRSEFIVSPRTKLKAKIRIEKEKEKYFSKNLGIQIETCVSFSKNQVEEVAVEREGVNCKYSYSSKWIEENNDYNTLLNNFIYLFGYVDSQMRLTFVSRIIEMGVFERTIFSRSRYDYPVSTTFNNKNSLALLQMTGYYLELKRNNIRLEEIIEWFFKSYLKEEFGVEGFTIKLPSANLTYLEKCRTIFPEMESVLKQYQLYVEDRYINKELLEISSTPLDYNNLPSILNEKKYIYGKGEKFERIKYYLSSDQCMLAYVQRLDKDYRNFYNLLCNEVVNIDDYSEHYKNDIKWLIENNIILVEANGNIVWKDKYIATILMDLSKNGVLSYWNCYKEFRNKINELKAEGFIEFSCSLLSKPEQDYISFILNKNRFANGYDIRNKCLHGTQANSESGEETHKIYYMYAMIVFIICIIKINDELCTLDLLKIKCEENKSN